jgi:hypothetical protein
LSRTCRTHPTALQTHEFSQFDRNLRLAEPDAPAQEALPTAVKRNKAARDCEYG